MPIINYKIRWLPRTVAGVGLVLGLAMISVGLGLIPAGLDRWLKVSAQWSWVAVFSTSLGIGLIWAVINFWTKVDHFPLLASIKPDTVAGRLTRRLLLISILLPPVGGLVEKFFLSQGAPVDVQTGLFALLQLLILSGIVLYVGLVLRKSERERDRAEHDRASALRQLEKQASLLQSEVARRTTELCQALAYNKRLALVAAYTTDAIIITDAKGLIEWVNEGFVRLTGYTMEEVAGRKPGALLQGELTDPATATFMHEKLASEQGVNIEVINYNKSGTPYWAELKIQPMRDTQGVVTGFMGTASDITARKSAEERTNAAKVEAEQLNAQLEQVIAQAQQSAIEANIASQAKSSFLATMSHEIRTPLNGVIGMAGLLRDTGLDERQLDFVRTIETSGDALLSIINDVLDYSKIEAGKIELESAPFDLRQCVEDALDLFAAKATEKKLELLSQIGPAVPGIIIGDVTRLRQIIVNLVGNALKFTATGEVVVVINSVSGQGDQNHEITIGVRDTGIGIPPDRLNRLFQPFSQVDSSTTRKYGGSGLGLAISRRLAEAMGGIMWVDSEPGKGSTFNFTIKTKSETTTKHSRWQESRDIFKGKHVLVVDDNGAVREWLTTHISGWGAHVTSADSGPTALAYLNGQEACDLALIDRTMPDMDGEKLAEAAKLIPHRAKLPCIMLSSLTNNATPQGFISVISKPMKPAPLFLSLDRAIGQAAAPEVGGANGSKSDKITTTTLSASGLSLLLVEDNPVNQRVASMLLGKLGFKPRIANNGQEALDALQEQPSDVILMDMEMPVLDGCETTQRIRGSATPTKPWIIALTANAMGADRNRAFTSGMNDFVTKPIRLSDLSTALERAADSMKEPTTESVTGKG